jgi:hypothetical protein
LLLVVVVVVVGRCSYWSYCRWFASTARKHAVATVAPLLTFFFSQPPPNVDSRRDVTNNEKQHFFSRSRVGYYRRRGSFTVQYIANHFFGITHRTNIRGIFARCQLYHDYGIFYRLVQCSCQIIDGQYGIGQSQRSKFVRSVTTVGTTRFWYWQFGRGTALVAHVREESDDVVVVVDAVVGLRQIARPVDGSIVADPSFLAKADGIQALVFCPRGLVRTNVALYSSLSTTRCVQQDQYCCCCRGGRQ